MDGFVSTTILSSKDGGLSYTEEQAVEGGEASTGAQRNSLVADNRTLYEQLQANKEKADELAAARYKMNFAPPKALDDEEAAFLDEQAENRRRREQLVHEQEEHDRTEFRAALASRTVVAPKLPEVDLEFDRDQSAQPTAAGKAGLKAAAPRIRVKPRIKGAGVLPVLKKRKADESGVGGSSSRAMESKAQDASTSERAAAGTGAGEGDGGGKDEGSRPVKVGKKSVGAPPSSAPAPSQAPATGKPSATGKPPSSSTPAPSKGLSVLAAYDSDSSSSDDDA